MTADGVPLIRDVLVSPIGFVADHLEVPCGIDIEAAAVARDAGLRIVRAETMDDGPTFIAGLADLVTAALQQPDGVV